MKKSIALLALVAVLIVATACVAQSGSQSGGGYPTVTDKTTIPTVPTEATKTLEPPKPTTRPTQPSPSYKDISCEIDGRQVSLVNGISEDNAAPGSSAKIATRYFGNAAFGDLNGDGKEDVAFLLTQNSGGSGTLSAKPSPAPEPR